MIPVGIRKAMIRQHYKVVGNHSAVKLCRWLKKSMRDEGFCYKQKFYGIQSHRCLQMTPWILCSNRCLYCWRIIEKTPIKIDKIDEPKDIIQGCIKAQRLLLTGFKGLDRANKKKWKEAQNPNQVAISLIGEPTLYPKISELISEFHKMKFTSFLVSNGQFPEKLGGMEEPTNLYISLDAPDKVTYRKLDRPSLPDYWGRLMRSLELMNSFSCKRVIRLTMVKNRNMKSSEKYAELIKKANPDFLEIKGYVHVGESQKRLPRETMPLHEEVREFAEKLSKESGYAYRDEQVQSRVVLLGK
jgi:tRNA wybutosine-synthesizing protein 1